MSTRRILSKNTDVVGKEVAGADMAYDGLYIQFNDIYCF